MFILKIIKIFLQIYNKYFKNRNYMAKKRKRYLVTSNSEAFACSLVTSPAMEETFVAFNEEKPMIEKFADEKKHMITGVVAIPNKPIYRRNKDGEEYDIVFSAEAIEAMAKNYLKDYKQHEVTLQHQENADGVYLVEQWIKTDMVYDKSIKVGLSRELPVGSWIQTYYVDSNDVWSRIESGELLGFSLECMLGLEEFESQINNYKIDKNDNDMEVNNESFWKQLKEVISECFSSPKVEEKEDLAANSGLTVEEYEKEVEAIKEELEEEKPTEAPVEEPKAEEPKTEEKPVEEPKEEPKAEETPKEEPKEEPKEDNHLEELINNLKAEIEALKEVNSGLQNKIKDLGKTPSTKPVSTNAKPNPKDTYSAWRETMRQYIS